MTGEILQAILSAEQQAVEKKAAAQEKAAQILLDGENKAQEIERECFNDCKAFLEDRQNVAKADAQKKFDEMIETKTKEAKEYCANALKGADNLVTEIVRRIVRGDC